MSSAPAAGLSTLHTEVIADDAGLARLAREWDELLDDSAEQVYFLRSGWNQLWWETFSPPGAQLFIITVRDGSGRLADLRHFTCVSAARQASLMSVN